MKMLQVPARYYRLYRDDQPLGCSEADFHYVENQLDIPLNQAALVLVDCWNVHYSESFCSRATRIVEEKIVPVVNAARQIGLPVIHAPTSRVAWKHEQSNKNFDGCDDEIPPTYASIDPQWPPQEFVEREGEYAGFRRLYHASGWKDHYPEFDIAEALTPEPEDYVVRSGDHLHNVLKHRKILHLFYAGFATNICLIHRDYGMKAMADRGYNMILIRDCTSALESHDTIDQMLTTRLFIHDIEWRLACSTISDDFIAACDQG